MTQGRHTTLTIQLTAGRTPDVAAMAAFVDHPCHACSTGADAVIAGRADADLPDCHDRRLHPPQYLQVGAAVSHRGLGRAGRQTPGGGIRRPAEGPSAGERVRADALPMVMHGAQRSCCMNNALLTRSYQALIYDEIEEYEQTIADLSAHLQADPTNTHALNNRAVAHGEIGHIDEALEGFRAAAAADPTHAVPHVNMGRLLEQLGHLSEAIAAYSAALQRQPTDAFSLRCRALALRQAGQLEEALADLNHAIELEPHFARTYADRAQLYRRLGRDREAQEDRQMFAQLSKA